MAHVDLDELIELMAHLESARRQLLPVLARLEQRETKRLQKRKERLDEPVRAQLGAEVPLQGTPGRVE